MSSKTFEKSKERRKKKIEGETLKFLIDYKRTNTSLRVKLLSDFIGCGSVVNNTLTSPGFPTPYPNNMHCVYNVSIPSRKALKISFSKFSLGLQYTQCW